MSLSELPWQHLPLMALRKIEVTLVSCLNVALVMSFISVGEKEKGNRQEEKIRIENKIKEIKEFL